MFRGFHEGMGSGGWVLMALFWVALLAVVARVVPSRKTEDREPQASAEEPVAILDRRLAHGEIDVETYDQLHSKLGHRPLAGKG
jgi:putative membrane protein